MIWETTIQMAKYDKIRIITVRRLLRIPKTSRRTSYSIIKETNPEYPMDRLILMLGKIEGRGSSQQKMIWCDSITDSVDMNLSKLQEAVEDKGAWHPRVCGFTNS